jgi:oxygen-independent coproporphyrinogen-3 oxidase
VESDTELSKRIERGEIRLDSEESAEELWFRGKALLERSGYANYEISNFARPGKECLHNMRYWRLEPYIGVGPGAVSTVPAAAALKLGHGLSNAVGEAHVIRLTNPHDIQGYLSGRNNLWGMEVETVSDRDFLLETLMMGLRTVSGIDGGLFRRRFGDTLEAIIPGRWQRWRAEGLAHEDTDALRLTEKGRLRLDGLLHEIAEDIRRGVAAPLRIQWP